MDKKSFGYYFNVVYFTAGELVLLLFGIPTSITPRANQEFRITILVIGLVILAITLARFAQRYRQKPNQSKLTVIFGLAFFTVAFGAKLLTTTFSMTLAYPRYFYDMTLYAIITSLYCFLLFGISMLITPFSEKPRSGLKITTDVIFAVVFTLYFVGQLALLFGAAGLFEDIADSVEYVMLVVALYVLVLLTIMAFKALGLAKRADKAHHRQGMIALGVTFLLLVTTVVLLLMNTIVVTDYDHLLEIVTLTIAVVAFYMLYLGFVRPANAERQST